MWEEESIGGVRKTRKRGIGIKSEKDERSSDIIQQERSTMKKYRYLRTVLIGYHSKKFRSLNPAF
jgi:hypothetical protein